MSLFSVDNGIVIGSFDNDSNENEDERPIQCSICNSLSNVDLNSIQAGQLEAQGDECITNPMKFVKNCNDWRRNWNFIKRGSINDTVKFRGCYKVDVHFEYNVWGKTVSTFYRFLKINADN